MESAVEHDADDGVEGIRAQLFGARHEVTGGVVDDRVDAAELFVGSVGGRFHGAVVSYIAASKSGRASAATNFVADFAQGLLAPSHQEHARAKHRKMQGHGAPQARATATEKNRPTLEHVLLEHESPPVGIEGTEVQRDFSLSEE